MGLPGNDPRRTKSGGQLSSAQSHTVTSKGKECNFKLGCLPIIRFPWKVFRIFRILLGTWHMGKEYENMNVKGKPVPSISLREEWWSVSCLQSSLKGADHWLRIKGYGENPYYCSPRDIEPKNCTFLHSQNECNCFKRHWKYGKTLKLCRNLGRSRVFGCPITQSDQTRESYNITKNWRRGGVMLSLLWGSYLHQFPGWRRSCCHDAWNCRTFIKYGIINWEKLLYSVLAAENWGVLFQMLTPVTGVLLNTAYIRWEKVIRATISGPCLERRIASCTIEYPSFMKESNQSEAYPEGCSPSDLVDDFVTCRYS